MKFTLDIIKILGRKNVVNNLTTKSETDVTSTVNY